MGRYEFSIFVAAPPERTFDVWTDPDRWPEWIGGVTKVTDLTGPVDRAGTRYTVHFGRMTSPTEVLDAERPHRIRTRFGNALLRGVMETAFEPKDGGTQLTQRLETDGVVSAVMARLFATGSWGGSFAGELAAFAKLAEQEAAGERPAR